jgi:hypothetical protein
LSDGGDFNDIGPETDTVENLRDSEAGKEAINRAVFDRSNRHLGFMLRRAIDWPSDIQGV